MGHRAWGIISLDSSRVFSFPGAPADAPRLRGVGGGTRVFLRRP